MNALENVISKYLFRKKRHVLSSRLDSICQHLVYIYTYFSAKVKYDINEASYVCEYITYRFKNVYTHPNLTFGLLSRCLPNKI